MIDLKQLEGLDLGALAIEQESTQSELSAVSRAVAAQFVRDLRSVFQEVLGGREHLVLDQLEELIRSLKRLAIASEDEPQLVLLDELEGATKTYRSRRSRGTGRASFLDCVRSWLPRYAEMLGSELGSDLHSMVDYESHDLPFFQELQDIRGIGPARLRRLFAAGLTHAQDFEAADPEEVAAVTGLPKALADQVCEKAEIYLAGRPERALADLHRSRTALLEVIPTLDLPEHLRAEALEALQQLERIREQLRSKI